MPDFSPTNVRVKRPPQPGAKSRGARAVPGRRTSGIWAKTGGKSADSAADIQRISPRLARKISIIIPVFNQESLTEQCLEAIRQTTPDGVEIVIADDGSTDGTSRLLAGLPKFIKVVRHEANQGFATTCNKGAQTASGAFLIFLNNDTIPQLGWLDALVSYALEHPKAAVVGSKLVYPTGMIQHAGVVICQDRYPRHIYAGFPADHPAVNQPRRFQIVTGACMLVRREIFEAAGGFDQAFRNGFEDVDFCLRVGQQGGEVHYCPESVLQHLESVSPGRFTYDQHNVARYRERWLSRVNPDDLQFYAADGLLTLNYEGTFPFQLSVSQELAVVNVNDRRSETERLLMERNRLVNSLTRENIRLRVALKGKAKNASELEYDRLRESIREAVRKHVPRGASILVVSKGDSLLLDLRDRLASHFPQTAQGIYAGYHPANSSEAIVHLEELQRRGAQYLLLPKTAFWWLNHYEQFAQHLTTRCQEIITQPECVIYALPAVPERTRSELLKTNPTEPPASPRSPKHRAKILYICHNHPSNSPGGAEIYALELYEAMRDSGNVEAVFLARTCSPEAADHYQRTGSRLMTVDNDANQYLFYTKTSEFDTFRSVLREDTSPQAFRDFLRLHQPEIIHFQHVLFLGHNFITIAREVLPHSAIIYTLHEYLPICHRNGQMLRTTDQEPCFDSSPERCQECFPQFTLAAFTTRKQILLQHFSSVDAFLCPSQFLLERYADWGVPRAKLVYEEYGRIRFHEVLETAETRPRDRFGFFGQMNAFKGINILLKAMQLLRTPSQKSVTSANRNRTLSAPRAISPHLWIYGANLEFQPEDFQVAIETLLAETQSNVTYFGRYERSDLSELMRSVDWVVVPSVWWENSPLVIQEAFAHGRPVICSDIGGMAEKVRDGVNGLHFSAGNAESLASTLTRACSMSDLWERLVAGIPPIHTMDKHLCSLNNLYSRVLNTKTTRSNRWI